MLQKKLRILVVFQIPKMPEDLPLKKYLQFEDWEDERDVIRALKKLGHKIILLGLKSDIALLIEEVKKQKPDLIFNLCENFGEDRKNEANLAGACELLNIPYTGSSPFSLHLCQDKGIQKKILSFDKKIKIPHFVTIPKKQTKQNFNSIHFPAIVKPLDLEASEGISQSSYVRNEESCKKRVSYLQKKYKSDVIVEDYIEGTDIYLALMGKNEKKILVGEPVQLYFSKYPDTKKTIATYRCKWDSEYRKKWGIRSILMKKSLLTEKIKKSCLETYKRLKLSGYVRFDLRLTQEGECFFLEANPNPSIAKNDEFSKSAKGIGYDYLKLIDQIISISLKGRN